MNCGTAGLAGLKKGGAAGSWLPGGAKMGWIEGLIRGHLGGQQPAYVLNMLIM